MGIPTINVVFKTAASTAIKRSERGIIAMLLRGTSTSAATYTVTDKDNIPATLSTENIAHIKRALIGNVTAPRKVLLYVGASGETDLTAGLAYFAAQKFDYMVAPPDVTATETAAIKTWILAQRADNDAVFKAVLPGTAADHYAIVNVTQEEAKTTDAAWTPAQLCARIAGIICGTPIAQSATYAVLPEVLDIKRLTRPEADSAVDAGKLILLHDGLKVKVARGVNSLVTLTADRGKPYQKIKIVEIIDMNTNDLRTACADTYIGK